MKELKPSGLFYVPVPIDAHNAMISHTVPNQGVSYNTNSTPNWVCEKLPKGKWELIGSVTVEHIDFDCHKIVESEYVAGGIMAYKNYTTNDFDFVFATDSLRSLLTANDVHFVNPYGDYATAHKRHILTGTWQQAESKLVEKILILKPL